MGKKDKAKAELIDLEVDEVSVVDRGANLRRYLITKNESGDLVMKTEEPMGTKKKVKKADESDLSSILFGGEGWDDDSSDTSDEMVVITKGLKTEIEAALQKIMGKLSKIAGKAKDIKKDVPSDVLTELSTIAEAVEALANQLSKDADGGTETTEKASDFGSMVIDATEALVAAANEIKALDDDTTEIPAALVDAIKKVAVMLMKAIERAGEEADDAEPDADDDAEVEQNDVAKMFGFEVFRVVQKDKDGKTQVVIKKADGKLKKMKLARFRKSVEYLTSLLKDLEDTPADKEETKKAVVEGLSGVTELLDTKLAEVMKAVEKIGEGQEAIKKRQDDFETANPGGNGEPGEDVDVITEPVEKSLWSGVLN